MLNLQKTIFLIRVKPGAKKPSVQQGKSRIEIAVREKAEDGKANEAALQALSRFLGVPRSRLAIIRGHHSPSKIVSVTEPENSSFNH